jgi:hypothetical protein
MRASFFQSVRRAVLAAVLLSVTGAIGRAQLPNPSPAAFAMGGNFTAIARGYEAVAWNPANLAMPGRPFLSFGLGVLGGSAGLDPIDLSAFNEFSGVLVDSASRVSWVEQAKLAGGEKGRLDGGVTWLALSVGPVGLQVGSSFYSSLNLSPDALDAVLFGNAGRSSGQAKPLDFTGTSVRTAAFTTGGLSFALPIPINLTNGFYMDERAAIGITGKYVVGHGVVVAQDQGSTFDGTTMQLRFPTVGPLTDESLQSVLGQPEYDGVAGKGVGADLAVSWSGGPWKVGLLAENVFNGFKWDTTKLAFMPGTGTGDFTTDNTTTDFDQQAYGAAPQELRDIIAAQKFRQAITLGAAFELMKSLTLTADMKRSMGDDEAIVIGPKNRFGVGAEWRIVPFIPLRAGVASVTEGWQAGAGVGFSFLGYELGLSSSIRRRGQATESGVMIGLVGIGR